MPEPSTAPLPAPAPGTGPTAEPFAADVIIVGGGPAGLSAGLTLGRARRSVLVIDAGEPRNAPATGVHNFLTRDGTSPAELAALGRAEVEAYGGRVVAGRATVAERIDGGFAVTLEDGRVERARRLVVTTGLVDELPEVDGLAERWGRDVLHCPYCHGWEFRDDAIGILGTDSWATHLALLFRQWTDDLTLFLHGAPELTADEREQLDARGVTVVDGPVAGLEVVDDRLAGVRLADGQVVACRALAVRTRLAARAGVLESLGVEVVEHPMGVGTHVVADPTGLTSAPGVWVAGNVADPMAQVVTSAAAGVLAAAAVNNDLIAEEVRIAVERRRAEVAAGA